MRIYVAGHRGMVGGAITRKLTERGVEVITRTHAELDLTSQDAVRGFFRRRSPMRWCWRRPRWGHLRQQHLSGSVHL
jgi:nucleoside-diphosphate-sugar epimerase